METFKKLYLKLAATNESKKKLKNMKNCEVKLEI